MRSNDRLVSGGSNKETIMLVEDNEIDALQVLDGFLDTNKKLPTYIFLDLFFSVDNAYVFLERFHNRMIRSIVKHKPKVFILSASINSHQKEVLNKNDYVLDYIEKPLTSKIIESIFRKYLQQEVINRHT